MHKSFGDNHVLRGCTLEVYPSETVCIIGRSGSGKTSVLSIVLGVSQPTRGVVEQPQRVEGIVEVGFTCRDLEGHIWTFGTYDPWGPGV